MREYIYIYYNTINCAIHAHFNWWDMARLVRTVLKQDDTYTIFKSI